MKTILAILAILAVSACKPPLITDPIKPTYAANLTNGCEAVEKLPPNTTKADLVDAWVDLKGSYRDICSRHDALVKALQHP